MKLITEYLPGTTQAIVEESEDGKKQLYIEGVFMQANKVNKNGRIYPTQILEGAVNKYIEEEVDTHGAIGELNHPNYPIPNPKFASHKIVKLEKEGDDFIGKALILNTPEGNIVRGLIEGNVRLGVSSRGLGTTKTLKGGVNEIQKDFQLKTVDIVHNPSAPDAFVNGILEGVEYLVDGSTIKETTVEEIEEEIKKCPASQLQAKKIELFERAMNEIMRT